MTWQTALVHGSTVHKVKSDEQHDPAPCHAAGLSSEEQRLDVIQRLIAW